MQNVYRLIVWACFCLFTSKNMLFFWLLFISHTRWITSPLWLSFVIFLAFQIMSLDNIQLTPVTFTEKEISILSLVASGSTDCEISLHLGYSSSYVSNLISGMFYKYKCKNRSHLIAIFVYSKVISSASSAFSQFYLT